MTLRFMVVLFVILVPLASYGSTESAAPASIQGIPVTSSNPRAIELLRQAQRMIDVGRPLEGQPLLEQAVQLDSHFSYAYILLANIALPAGFSYGYVLLANVGISTEEFKRNLDTAMNNVEGKSEGERLLIEIHQTFIDNNATKRIELAKSLVEKYPLSPRAWLTLGLMQGTINHFTESRQSILKALELDPKFVGAHYGLAFSYLFNEPRDFKQAEEHLQACIRLEPFEAKGYEGLGDAYRAMNQLQQAGDAYSKAIKIDSKLDTASVKKGHVDSFLGKFEEARADYDQAIQKAEPINKVAYANLRAFTHLHAGEPKAALDELQQLADSLETRGLSSDQIDSLKQTTLTNEITIALHSNLLAEAENVLAKLKIVNDRIHQRVNDPDLSRQSNAAFVLLEGQLAARKKDYAAARAKAEENRKMVEPDQNPRKLEGYYSLLGLIDLLEEKYSDAIADYEKADLTNLYVKYQLGLAYAGSGQSSKAKKQFEDVARFNFNTVEFALVRNDALKRLA